MVASKATEPSPKRQRLSSKPESTRRFDDLANIQDAQVEGDSLGSPSVRAALDQLLSTRKLSSSTTDMVQKALRHVKLSLDNLSKESRTISVDSTKTSKLISKLISSNISQDTLFHSPQDKSLSVDCERPTNINVIGSFLLGYASSPVADIAIEMPSSMFQSKDYINYKYHDKRLLYLIYIANHFIKKEGKDWKNLSIADYYLAGDIQKPTLSLSHKEFPQITIRLIPTFNSDVFEPSRLGDDRRNVRPAGSSSVVTEKSKATIGYNNSILLDSIPVKVLQTLYSISSTTPNFTDCVLLLEAWSIRQRFNQSKFIFAVLVADLITRSIVPKRASREQLLRCSFNALRSRILNRLSIHNVKVCTHMSEPLLIRIAECAKTALIIIESETASDDPWNGVVPHLFATARGVKLGPRPMSTLFDGFIHVHYTNGKNLPRLLVGQIENVLDKSFVETGRISKIERIQNGLYGLSFVSHQDIIRKVDIVKDDLSAEEFKTFWGTKSSLRRFKDGKISESLVWNGGMRTLNEIAEYVNDKHFPEEMLQFKVFVGELEKVAKLPDMDIPANQAISSYNELSKLLRTIEGLPLRIHDVHASSPHLRRCGMYAIRPNSCNRFIEPLDIVASFENSNAWPNDAVAIAASKAAFYVGLRSKLLEKGISAHATISFLEISLGGFVFRLRLRVEKELELLNKNGSEEGKKLKWETENMVRHHDDVRRVESLMMTQVCRLAKRWLNSQLLFGCLGDRRDSLIELIVVSVMCHSSMKKGSMESTMRGFCQFLHLLAEYPWEVCPLVVSFVSPDEDDEDDEDSSKRQEAITKAQKHFNQSQENVFGVYAAHGESVEPWMTVKDSLENVIVRRIQMTAKAALDYMEQYITSPNMESSLNTVFTTDVSDFDAVIELDERACVMKNKSSEGPLTSGKGSGMYVVGLDPVQRMWEVVEQRIGKWAVVFGRVRSGSRLYVVWRPVVSTPFKFSLRDTAFCDVDEAGRLCVSTDQIVDEIKRVGQGLIVRVEQI